MPQDDFPTKDNKLLAVVRITIAGKEFCLKFTWAELAEIESRWGQNIEGYIGKLDVLSEVAAIGMRAYHPGITAEQITLMSPPVFPLHAAVLKALRYSYFGGQDPDETAAEIKGAKKKRNLLKVFLRWLTGTA